MKTIVYALADGSVCVVSPNEGARLANSVTLQDGTILTSATPQRVDQFLRQWPVQGATADWAETEAQFADWIKNKDVPAQFLAGALVVDQSTLPDRAKRSAWRVSAGAVVIDPTASSQMDLTATRLGTDESERVACKGDSTIMGLINQTRAEWVTWAGANFPSLTAAEKQRLGLLFWVVAIGVRKGVRNAVG